MDEDGSLTDPPLENLEGGLFIFCPIPFMIFLEQCMERFHHVRKPRDPSVVEIDETDEFVHTHSSGLLPQHDICDLFVIHFKTLVTDIDSEEFYFLLMEFTFLCITERFCIFKTLECVMDTLDMLCFSLVMVECII
jgi:hypothetical protein